MSSKRGNRWFAAATMTAMFLVIVMTGAHAEEQQLKIQDLRRAIRHQGAGWIAGENEISRLPQPEFQNLLGLRLDPDPLVRAPGDPLINENSFKGVLPAVFDWRNYKGTNYVTSIKRQQCGDCWAHSAAATLESRLMIEGQDALDLSEQLMVSSCFSGGSCGGGYILSASKYLVDVGIPEESCYPYLGHDSSCGEACPDWRNITYRASTYTPVEQTVEALKTALYTRGPVNVGYMVYSDFSAYRSGIYEYTSGNRQGGHGVMIVGYDDNQQCFIVKNSWGKNWGENGYFRIAYSQVYNQVGFGMQASTLGKEIDHDQDVDDNDPPTPDPMSWKTQPAATGSTAISMTAETASDVSGVSYYFECVSGECHDSGWQDSPTYNDTELKPETTYAYRVKARDKSPHQNETGWSAESEATTRDGRSAVEMISPFRSGTSHPAPQGQNRLVVLSLHAEDDNTNVRATNVSYGGQPMTLATEQHVGSGYRAYVAVFVLSEDGIAKVNGGDFEVEWSEQPSRAPGYTSAVFSNVDPNQPVSTTDGAGGNANTLSTAALETQPGGMALVAATCGNTGSYDVAGAFAEALELDLPSSDAVIGYQPTDGQQVTPEVSHTNANRQAAVGLVLSLAGGVTPPPPPPGSDSMVEILGDWQSGSQHTLANGSNRLLVFTVHAEDDDTDVTADTVLYGGQEMRKVTEAHIATGYRAYVAIFVLDEAGLSAAQGNDFSIDWSQTPYRQPGFSSVCLANVDQNQPIGEFDSVSSTSASTQTAALDNDLGDLQILAGACGNTGVYTVSKGFTKAVELNMVSSDGVTGYLQSSGQAESAGVAHSRVNRQALASVVVNTK